MSTILVGVDFSDAGARALEEARSLARALGAEPELLHVTTAPRGWLADDEATAWMEREGVEPTSLGVRHGTPWVELARGAAERGALLIVVGSHGRGGYQPVALGSTALRLTMAATRPVLVVGRRSAALAPAPETRNPGPARTDVPSSTDPAGSGERRTNEE